MNLQKNIEPAYLRNLLLAGILIFLTYCNRLKNSEAGGGDTITKEEINNLKREEPGIYGSVILTRSEFKGMKLFMKKCDKCHPAGEKGKGPSLIDKKIPDFLVHAQVRVGLGDMPSFKKQELSKEDVKKIILFVRILREVNLNTAKS